MLMAYKKRGAYARRRRGKAFKKRTYRRKRGITTNQGRLGPVAPRTFVRLKYNEVLSTADSNWASGIDYMFNMNSIFDPNRSGTGHQPLGHDQWMTFYNRYRVHKVTYVISLTGQVGYQNTAALLCNNDGSVFTDPTRFAEQPRTIMKQVSGSGDAIYFKGSIYPRKITGVSAATYNSDDRYQAVFGASPAEVIPLHIGHWSSLYGTQDTHAFFNITLVYHCELFDPNPIAQS